MLIQLNHYYKLINQSGNEFIFKALKQEANGWIIEIIRTNSNRWMKIPNGFLNTYSNGKTLKQDNVREMADDEILAITL